LRASLEEAVARGRQVRLTYYVPARDEESERVVDPRGVVTSSGVAYLDAWCHSAEAPRLFRLDRIHEAAVLDSAVATAPEPPRDLSDGLFQRSQETTLVTLALQPQARWVVEYYQVEQVRPGSDGTLEVDMKVADERWLRRLLMRLAPYARVVSPPELDADFRATAQRTLSLYRSGT
jgi:proteasome accessory factor C